MSENERRSDSPAASHLVAACEHAWQAIRRRHAEIPDVVLVLGTGVERGRLVKLGHWWDGRWTADGEVRGEVLLAGEALHLSPAQVFEVLLHEAAHGLNAVRGIKDASRGGRYHNARFKATADELGLVTAQMRPYGWAQTELGPDALEGYASEIAAIGDAMRIARRLSRNARPGSRDETAEVGVESGEGPAGADFERSSAARPAMCGCGRRLRMAPSVLAQGPVLCGLCGQEFSTEWAAEQADRPQGVDSARTATTDIRPPSQTDGAVRALTTLAATVDGAFVLAQVGAWGDANRSGDQWAIELHTVDELAEANLAVRAILQLEGELTGGAVEVAGWELLVGQLVIVGERDGLFVDLDGVELPPPGVVGKVVDTDTIAETFVVDFPITGMNRIGVHSSAAASLEYGYAEVVPHVGAPLIDLRTLPEEVPPDRPESHPEPEFSW